MNVKQKMLPVLRKRNGRQLSEAISGIDLTFRQVVDMLDGLEKNLHEKRVRAERRRFTFLGFVAGLAFAGPNVYIMLGSAISCASLGYAYARLFRK